MIYYFQPENSLVPGLSRGPCRYPEDPSIPHLVRVGSSRLHHHQRTLPAYKVADISSPLNNVKIG